VDIFILDGLRAKDVASLPEIDEGQKQEVFKENWVNALGALGQAILAADLRGRVETFRQIVNRASTRHNPTLAADIVGAMTHVDASSVDLQGLRVIGGAFTELNLNNTPLRNLEISEATIERLVLPNSPPTGVTITRSLAGEVSGAASYSGLPNWVQLDSVDHFDTVQTVAQIRKVGLSPAHEILVAILKKTFKQKGAGRKEEALLRGFGAGASKKIADSIISLLMSEGVLSRHKGDEGWIYNPSRSHTSRVSAILDQLRVRPETSLGIA
jgi:hypothetical protein